MTLTIERKHNKQYDYYYYVVKFEEANYQFIGMKEDIMARLEHDLEKGE